MVLCLIAFVGCAGGRFPRVERGKISGERFCRIAIIPLKNETKNYEISKILYKVLLTEMVSETGADVVEEGEVRSFFIYEHIFPGEFLNVDMLRVFRERTGAQAVMGGRIMEAMENRGKVVLAFYLWIRDTYTGKVLWSVYHKRSGEDYLKWLHFGKVSVLSELADKMVQEVLRKLRREGIISCEP